MAISVLTDTTGAKRGMGKQQFLDHLADSLTAAEQVMTACSLCDVWLLAVDGALGVAAGNRPDTN